MSRNQIYFVGSLGLSKTGISVSSLGINIWMGTDGIREIKDEDQKQRISRDSDNFSINLSGNVHDQHDLNSRLRAITPSIASVIM